MENWFSHDTIELGFFLAGCILTENLRKHTKTDVSIFQLDTYSKGRNQFLTAFLIDGFIEFPVDIVRDRVHIHMETGNMVIITHLFYLSCDIGLSGTHFPGYPDWILADDAGFERLLDPGSHESGNIVSNLENVLHS